MTTTITQTERAQWRDEALESVSLYEAGTVGHEEGKRLLRLINSLEAAEAERGWLAGRCALKIYFSQGHGVYSHQTAGDWIDDARRATQKGEKS